jgi:hypothetical protein
MATAEKPKERPSALRSIIAGSTAGAVEIGMLFPVLNCGPGGLCDWEFLADMLVV